MRRRVGSLGLWLLLLGLLPVQQALAAPPSNHGDVEGTPSSAFKAPSVDVGILVNPISSTTAYVGIGYNTRVPFTRVRKEIEQLTKGTGWQIGKLHIEDSSPRPDNPKKFPKTTGAEFFLQQAPQVADRAPALQPYLRAFQAWDNLEVIFRRPEQVSATSEDFENRAMHIRLIKDVGVYRYDVDIRDHAGPLPSKIEFIQPEVATPAITAVPVTRPASSSSFFALLLIAAGGGLAVCAGAWLLLSRRTVSGVSARTFRQ